MFTDPFSVGSRTFTALLSLSRSPTTAIAGIFISVASRIFFPRVSLLLSAVGIYGVMAYLVKQRTAEIGLRMAIGATAVHVLRLVVGRAMWLVAVGTVVGLVAAFVLTRFLGAMLFDVGTTDLATYGSVTAVLVLVAFAASLLPAKQATKVDPLTTLRVE